MGDASRAVRLLTEKDEQLIEKLAEDLNAENITRQKFRKKYIERHWNRLNPMTNILPKTYWWFTVMTGITEL